METKKVAQVDKNGHYLGTRIVEDGYSYPTRFNDRFNFERIMQQIKHAHTVMEIRYETLANTEEVLSDDTENLFCS